MQRDSWSVISCLYGSPAFWHGKLVTVGLVLFTFGYFGYLPQVEPKTECLLYAKQYPRFWDPAVNKRDKIPAPRSSQLQREIIREKESVVSRERGTPRKLWGLREDS